MRSAERRKVYVLGVESLGPYEYGLVSRRHFSLAPVAYGLGRLLMLVALLSGEGWDVAT